MQMVINQEDIRFMALSIAEVLLPMLGGGPKEEDDDCVMTVEELAGFLKVSSDWVYRQVSNCAIPVTRAGKALRFQKKDILKWLGTQTAEPVENNPATRELRKMKQRHGDCESPSLH